MSPSSLVILVVLILWATDIGPEELLVMPAAEGKSPEHKIVTSSKIDSGMKRRGQADFLEREKISKKLFLREFKIQSTKLELTSCLRETGTETGTVLVSATLLANGTLQEIHAVNPAESLPACALQIIEKMMFKDSGLEIQNDVHAHTIIWRVDW